VIARDCHDEKDDGRKLDSRRCTMRIRGPCECARRRKPRGPSAPERFKGHNRAMLWLAFARFIAAAAGKLPLKPNPRRDVRPEAGRAKDE